MWTWVTTLPHVTDVTIRKKIRKKIQRSRVQGFLYWEEMKVSSPITGPDIGHIIAYNCPSRAIIHSSDNIFRRVRRLRRLKETQETFGRHARRWELGIFG